MNVIEEMMMMALTEAVRTGSEPLSPESKLGVEEVQALMAELDPAKAHGVVILAVSEEPPNAAGAPGISLLSAMVGSPVVLKALVGVGDSMLRQEALKHEMKNHPLGALFEQMFEQMFGGGVTESEKASERFSSEGRTKQ